jgi:hypothetical protein
MASPEKLRYDRIGGPEAAKIGERGRFAMSLPPLAGGIDRRVAWRPTALALASLLLLFPILAPLSRAQEVENPYTATVKVDATADTAAKAREAARLDGQRRALSAVADRLSGGGAKLAKLDDKTIADLVANFEVANERMSAVRYLADYTFHFRAEPVQRVLRGAGIALSGEPGKEGSKEAGKDTGASLVLLPVYQPAGEALLWEDSNPWREAWAEAPPGWEASHLSVPLGDISDIAAIDAAKARAGDAEALAAIARQNGGEEAIVALATPRGPPDRPSGLDIVLRRYRAGRLVDSRPAALTAKPGEVMGDFLRRAVVAVTTDINSGWKKEAAPHYDQQGSLIAALPINGLDDWVKLRDRLAGVPTIRKVALVALSLQEATIEIEYVGNIDQLKASLTGLSLDLVQGDPGWRLARSAAPGVR